MPWNLIKEKAFKFSNEWKNAYREKSESQTFWNEFFEIFNIKRRRIWLYMKSKFKN